MVCRDLDERTLFLDNDSWLRKLGVTPWNKGIYHPTLREAIEDSGVEFPRGSDKRALIPGCGEVRWRFLSLAFLIVVCRVTMWLILLLLSESTQPGWTYHQQPLSELTGRFNVMTEKSVAKNSQTSIVRSNPDALKNLTSYAVQNFFDLKPESEADRYDLIYDFTYICIIFPYTLVTEQLFKQLLCRDQSLATS